MIVPDTSVPGGWLCNHSCQPQRGHLLGRRGSHPMPARHPARARGHHLLRLGDASTSRSAIPAAAARRNVAASSTSTSATTTPGTARATRPRAARSASASRRTPTTWSRSSKSRCWTASRHDWPGCAPSSRLSLNCRVPRKRARARARARARKSRPSLASPFGRPGFLARARPARAAPSWARRQGLHSSHMIQGPSGTGTGTFTGTRAISIQGHALRPRRGTSCTSCRCHTDKARFYRQRAGSPARPARRPACAFAA